MLLRSLGCFWLVSMALGGFSCGGASSKSSSAADTAAAHAEGAAGSNKDQSRGEADAGGADPSAAQLTDADSGAATFSAVYDNVFHKFCAADFCHGGGTAGFSVATRTDAYATLVGIPANPTRKCGDRGLVRVVPGEPENSLLFLKLSVTGVPCGQQMPVGGSLKPELQQLIKDWIAAGALDD